MGFAWIYVSWCHYARLNFLHLGLFIALLTSRVGRLILDLIEAKRPKVKFISLK